jgi:hypothetical protein
MGASNTQIDTGITLGTGTAYTLNDCHIMIKVTNDAGITNHAPMGIRDSGVASDMSLFPEAGGPSQVVDLNDQVAAGSAHGFNSVHLFLGQRENSSSTIKLYRDDGTLQETMSSTSVALPTVSNVFIGSIANFAYDPEHNLGFGSFGKHLTNPAGCQNAITSYLSHF